MSADDLSPAQAFTLLGIQPPTLQRSMSQDQIDAAVQAWKDGPVKRAHRALVKRWHPDLGDGTDTDERTQRTAQANRALHLCRSLQVHKRQPVQPQQMRVVIIRQGWHGGVHVASGFGMGGTSNATTASGFGWPGNGDGW